jgi:hypothetical protein
VHVGKAWQKEAEAVVIFSFRVVFAVLAKVVIQNK